jgi:hypothetical protein
MKNPSHSEYFTISFLAKKLKISNDQLMLAIQQHQIPICIKLPPHMASRLRGGQNRSEKMMGLLTSNPELFPDPSSFPKNMPQLVYTPLTTSCIDQLMADPTAVMNLRYLCKVIDGQLVPIDLHPTNTHLTVADIVLLNEHANSLTHALAHETGRDDDPLSKRERGSLLRTIGALMDILLQTHAGGGTEDAVIMDIIATYPDQAGLSRSNLQKIFAQSKLALDRKELKMLDLR